MSVTQAFLEQAYLAYFGRPVDPNGAVWYLRPSVTEAQVIEEFSHSPESQALYGNVYDLTFVNNIYQNLFNRDADITGGTWWVNQLLTGAVKPAEAALAIMNGAQPNSQDGIAIQNKLLASHAFTASLDTAAEITGFAGTPALDSSRVFLHSVTSTPATPAQVSDAVTTALGAGQLIVNSPSVLEGDAGVNQQLVFTLTLSAAQTTDTVINFATQTNGTALPGVDFVAATGTVTIPAFQTTVTVPVTVIGDNVIQPDQTVKVLFSSDAIVASVTATGTIINDDVPVVPPVLPETFVLTTGQDVFTGNAADDQFLATQSTLQLGDRLTGGEGHDVLDVSISGFFGLNTGFTADSIETIAVKSLAVGPSTLNLSDVRGVTTLESNESSGALSFVDIQSVNGTDISITDTSATHSFNYDTNAFTAGIDAVDLRLAEVTGAQIDFSTGSSSVGVEQINIDSQDNPNPIAGDSDATVNTVSDLNVGNKLTTVNIKGNADLTVVAPLDVNVQLVDAHTLDGNLTLDLSSSNDGNPGSTGDDASTVEEIVYIGALQNDHVEFGSTDNAKNVTLGDGNDWVRTGIGVAFVDGGSGNDTIITGALNDLVLGGAGNDVVIDAGADNATTGWTTRYIAGGNDFTLGLGDDSLTVTGSGNNTADLGAGNDFALVGGEDNIVNGHQSVIAGDGNDEVTLYANGWADVDLGVGNDSLYIERGRQVIADTTVTAGAGDDGVVIYSNGNVHGTGGDGNDSFYIQGNGGHTLDLGAGNDTVNIYGDGTHSITLGAGDDYLNIAGARNTAGNADNGATDGITVINAGDGNDTVYVAADHYLGADLGAGNDAIHLRAQDLTSDDTVAGGVGNDTIWLSNESESSQDGRVLASETIHTTGFETYELQNSNITLKLTDRMITTAENQDLTVSTVNSNSFELPGLVSTSANAWIYPLFQGITNAQFDVLVAQTRAGDFDYTPNAPTLHNKAYYDNLAGPESARLAAADADLRAYISQFVKIDNTDTNHDGDKTDALDQLFFLKESGVQTIDMTGITTPEYKFTLEGGNVADVVIGNDATINGQMTLNYNFGGSQSTAGSDRTALSVEDTLVVVAGAEITAADLRHVDGLERIVLKGGGNGVPQTWGIELTDRVIDQTTGSAALNIIVDSNVEAGSKVYITLDPSIVNASNDVIIHKNANVQVYINGALVTEPQLGQDFNPGIYSITVVNELVFTANADNLVGTNNDDTFVANQLAHIQAGDSANGNGGFDKLALNFAVSNGANTLQEIFNDASLTSIERIEFNTGNNVTFGGIGAGYDTLLAELATGNGNDTLTLMREGVLYELNDGNDFVSLINVNYSGKDTRVDGGNGLDTVVGSNGGEYIVIRNVESVNGGNGLDTVSIEQRSSDVGSLRLMSFLDVETIYGSQSDDNIYADSNGGTIYVDGEWGADTINVANNTPTSATVSGGEYADSINVYASTNAVVHGDYNDGEEWWRYNGNDTITVHAPNATVTGEGGADSITVYASTQSNVDGGTGNDTVFIGNTVSGNTTVNGGDGNDSVYVDDISNAVVTGGNGNDTITAKHITLDSNLDGGDGNDSISTNWANNVTVLGGNGNDTILANDTFIKATVDGGTGNDSITVSANSSGTTITVTGGEGNDTITVGYNGQGGTGPTTITGGEGNDVINLFVATNAGADTLVFGNITYDGLQNENFNDQSTLNDPLHGDTITGFNWEPAGPTAGAQDVLNFSAFNGPVGSVVNTNALGTVAGQVNVVETTNNAFILTNANWATSGFTMANNSKGVLIIGKDTDGTDGLNHFDVYYVQDVDSGADVAVKVNLVGTIDSATNVGLTTITGANFA